MRKTVFTLCFISLYSAAFADGVSPGALADPNVAPIFRQPSPLAAPVVITESQPGAGFCQNSQNPGPARSTYGYEVRLACDHIFVGLAVLGGLALLGVAESDSATAE